MAEGAGRSATDARPEATRSGSAGATPALERVTAFDDARLVPGDEPFPVDAPPFEAPEHRGARRWAQYVAMRGALASVSRLPRPLREGLVRAIAAGARVVDRRHTAAARDFVRTALPDLDDAGVERLVREAWRHLLRVTITADGLARHLLGRRLGDHYAVEAVPEVLELLERRVACVVVTAHVGYWEAAPPASIAMGFRPSYIVGKAPRNDHAARYLARTREAMGVRLLPRAGAMTAVPAAIRAGAHVGLLLDHRPRQKPIWAPFFGRLAACDRSAGVLLRRLGAPLVLQGCYGGPRPWSFVLRFPKVLPPEELAALAPEEVAARVNRELEALVLHRPDEYFWLHDRYRGAPPAGDEPASGA